MLYIWFAIPIFFASIFYFVRFVVSLLGVHHFRHSFIPFFVFYFLSAAMQFLHIVISKCFLFLLWLTPLTTTLFQWISLTKSVKNGIQNMDSKFPFGAKSLKWFGASWLAIYCVWYETLKWKRMSCCWPCITTAWYRRKSKIWYIQCSFGQW